MLWANHAIQRAAEYGFTSEQIFTSWNRSTEEILSRKQQEYKFRRYGMSSLRDKWFYDVIANILFTVSIGKTGQWYIQTVTKGKGSFIK